MKRVVFVFSIAPHGTAAGQEGLDALLATPTLADDLIVFFIVDGVFQLLSGQKPDAVLVCDYIAIFKSLSLYGVEQCWAYAASLHERGLDSQASFIVEATPLETDTLRREPTSYDVILRF